MNTIVIKRGASQIAQNITIGKPLIVMALLSLFVLTPSTREVITISMVDAYLQVSVFVAGTLGVLFLIEKAGRTNIEQVLRNNPRSQVLIAASLGALPGCGGAIMVTTQYVRGAMSFGGVVSVLSATMGDAAFLLLAKEPVVALWVFVTCFVTGIVTGTIVDLIHGDGFMRVKSDYCDGEEELIVENELLSPFYRVWMALFVPGAIAGVMLAFQVDLAAIVKDHIGLDLITTLALVAALLSIAMWMVNPVSDFRLFTSSKRTLERRVCDTTNFVTFWVIVGYVAYALLESIAGFDLRTLFQSWSVALPMIALLVGFIPGCGPQIVVTTLYINGVIPLSALLANAISNDGDALFPAIAVAPKAAILATLYTAVPAFIVGYGYFFLFE